MLDGNDVYLFNNKDISEDLPKMKQRLKKILVNSAKALKSDLEDYEIVGCGFWEDTEQKIIEMLEEIRFWEDMSPQELRR